MSRDERYRYYADGILAIHFLWTLIIFGGVVLMFVWHPYALAEIIVVSVTLLSSLPFGAVCPLTLLEERLRRKTDPAYRNDGSYIATYFNKIFHTDFQPRVVNATVGVFYTLVYAVGTYFLVTGK